MRPAFTAHGLDRCPAQHRCGRVAACSAAHVSAMPWHLAVSFDNWVSQTGPNISDNCPTDRLPTAIARLNQTQGFATSTARVTDPAMQHLSLSASWKCSQPVTLAPQKPKPKRRNTPVQNRSQGRITLNRQALPGSFGFTPITSTCVSHD